MKFVRTWKEKKDLPLLHQLQNISMSKETTEKAEIIVIKIIIDRTMEIINIIEIIKTVAEIISSVVMTVDCH